MKDFVNLRVNPKSDNAGMGPEWIIAHVTEIAVMSQHDAALPGCRRECFVIRIAFTLAVESGSILRLK